MGNNNLMVNYKKTDDIFADMQELIETAQKAAHSAVNTLLVQRNWLIGYRIAEEELKGENRAEYGMSIIKQLSKNCRNYMERDLRKQIYIAFIHFTKPFLRFSTQRVENLLRYFHGLIIVYYCKFMMQKLVIGMQKKQQNKLGV